jgi:hypothetical protein
VTAFRYHQLPAYGGVLADRRGVGGGVQPVAVTADQVDRHPDGLEKGREVDVTALAQRAEHGSGTAGPGQRGSRQRRVQPGRPGHEGRQGQHAQDP